MAPGIDESRNVSLAGYHDLEGRPGFKIAIKEADGRYLLYLAHFWHQGWSIIDVTDPESPEYLRFVEGPDNTTTKQIQVADDLMICALERPGTGGPVGGEKTDPSEPYETGAYVFDVGSDPTDPEFLSHWETGGRGTHRNFYTGGDYAYMCASPGDWDDVPDDDEESPSKSFYVKVLDVSDPENPTEAGEWKHPHQRPDYEGERYSHYFHGPAYVVDDRAYVSYGRPGIVELDVSDPTDPEMIYEGYFGDMIGGYNGVHSFIPIPGTDLAVVNSENTLEGSPLNHDNGEPIGFTYIVDISDKRDPGFTYRYHHGPRIVSSMPQPRPEEHLPYDSYYHKPGRFGAHNQHHPQEAGPRLVTDEYLFMAYFNAGLRVFDISDPLTPTEAGYYVPEAPEERIGVGRPRNELGTQFEDVVVDDRGFVYCTDPNHGLFVLETPLV